MSGCCGTPAGNAKLATSPESVRAEVRTHYRGAALAVVGGTGTGCCGAGSSCGDPISSNLYDESEGAELPGKAVAASLGCGNPTALAELRPGDVVLDLGSGGGIDVLLSAKRVSPGGKAIGLDMTDEMLELARANQLEAGITNAEFLKGQIEAVPLPDATVDVVISNCVVNLSPEKDRVMSEVYRVLRPGGRVAIADIVFRTPPAEELRDAVALWGACIGGALTESDYREKLSTAGFVEIEIERTREYGEELMESYPELAISKDVLEAGLGSAFIRARKP